MPGNSNAVPEYLVAATIRRALGYDPLRGRVLGTDLDRLIRHLLRRDATPSDCRADGDASWSVN